MKRSINPQQIYEDHKNRRFTKVETAKKLIKIIESGNTPSHIVSSIELLRELIINDYFPHFLFTLYDLIGWSEDPLFESIKNELFKKIATRVWEFVGEGVIYEEAILLTLFEKINPEKLIKINFNEDLNDIYEGFLMHYKISEDGHILGLYFGPVGGDPGQIPFIPENIYRLHHLEEFVIHQCELETIPETIGRLKSLKVLILDYNMIVNLPQSIGSLDSLEELSLSNNYIEALPESIDSLKSLKKLDLDENDIKIIPDSVIPFLKKLEQFSCDQGVLNRLGSIIK